MNEDLWRQWQSFAAHFVPPGVVSPSNTARDAASAFAPYADAAERFKGAAQAFFDSASADPASIAGAAQKLGEFLREQFASQAPWAAGLGAGFAKEAPPASAFDWPALGATREHQQRWRRMAEDWGQLDDAQRRLQRLWSDALREAATAFAARLQQRQPTGTLGPQALRELYDAWIDCAEESYARMAHSEAFGTAQGDFVNASSQWRRQFLASIEQWLKALDLPTRSELNTLARRLKAVEERPQGAGAKAQAAPAKAKRPAKPRPPRTQRRRSKR